MIKEDCTYTPILRWKAAEKSALGEMYEDDRKNTVPLIEYIMPYKSTLKESQDVFLSKLPSELEYIEKHWGQRQIYVDVHLIDNATRAEALKIIFSFAEHHDLFLVPTTFIIPVVSSDTDMQTRLLAVEYAKKTMCGICIRIARVHMEQKDIKKEVLSFIHKNNINPEIVDILIDYNIVGKQDIQDCKALIQKLQASIPNIHSWRSLTIAGGSFPRDLSEFEQHSDESIERREFVLWKEMSRHLGRKPSFADYTIQHPIYYNPIPYANVSASIRYACENEWVIKRGEGLLNKEGGGHKQYIAHAQVLARDAIFKGEKFSAGDAYIHTIGSQSIEEGKTGNPKTWLQCGINHHMTLTARQIASYA